MTNDLPVKISFLLKERTPYHDILFKEMSNNENIKLVVYYLRQPSKRRPWEFDSSLTTSYYCTSYIELYKVFLKRLKNDKLNIVIFGGYGHPKLLLSLFTMNWLKIPFAVWADVPRFNIKRPWIIRILKSFFQKWLFKNARAILVTGQLGVEAYKKLGCPEDKLRNLTYGVDLITPLQIDETIKSYGDQAKARYAPSGETIFLGVGRLVPRKGYDLAIEALAKTLTANPGLKAVLLLAGDGPEMPYLQELVEKLHLANSVHFLGWLHPKEVTGLYYASDVLVHPARWDPYPNVILEAMAWGKTVLTSDETPIDRIFHGENGFFHHTGNVEELSEQMLNLLNDRALIARMGVAARQTAEAWPPSRSVQTIIDIVYTIEIA